MATLHDTAAFRPHSRWSAFFESVVREWVVMTEALSAPNQLAEDMQQVHDLLVEADRIEATEPLRALALRRAASRIGLP